MPGRSRSTRRSFSWRPALAHMEATLERHDLTAVRLPGAIMVDSAPDEAPDPGVPLTQQKQCGIWEDEFDFKAYAIPGLSFPTRSRIHHRYAIGAYTPGRHSSHLPGQCAGNRELGRHMVVRVQPLDRRLQGAQAAYLDAPGRLRPEARLRRPARGQPSGARRRAGASCRRPPHRCFRSKRPSLDIAVARIGASRAVSLGQA